MLAYIASQDRLITALMKTTGISADEIRNQASDPEFLGEIMDFLFAREADFLDFCAGESIKPDSVERLRAELPGGPSGLWI